MNKYNRALIKGDPKTDPFVKEILDKTSDSEMEYWIVKSKDSFHGEHDGEFFYFKDSRIENGTKLPLSSVQLEFTDEEL